MCVVKVIEVLGAPSYREAKPGEARHWELWSFSARVTVDEHTTPAVRTLKVWNKAALAELVADGAVFEGKRDNKKALAANKKTLPEYQLVKRLDVDAGELPLAAVVPDPVAGGSGRMIPDKQLALIKAHELVMAAVKSGMYADPDEAQAAVIRYAKQYLAEIF